MNILFIYSGAENLGIEYIASFLKSKGHKVSLLFDPDIFSGEYILNNKSLSRLFSINRIIIKRAVELAPDLIGFSAYTGNYRWCLNLAQEIKKVSRATIVFGGVHTTATPGRVLSNDCIDYAIIGEAEFAMLDLVKHIEKSNGSGDLLDTANICFRYQGNVRINRPRPYVRDLDSFPFPDKSLFYNKVPLFEEKYLIITSRGCLFNCTYCSNNMYHKLYPEEKQHFRRRSPDNVIDELLYVKKRGRARLIVFVDDVFAYDELWLGKFIEKYKRKINLPFFCFAHASTVTKKMAVLLKEGGCRIMTVGVQSFSENLRRKIFRRTDSNEQIIEAIARIRETGIKVSVDNIFGAPTETEDDLKQCLNLYDKIKAARIQTFWLTYYPKTDIIDSAKNQGILSDKEIEKIENGYVGYTHDTGSVRADKIGIYARYELIFQLRSLTHSNRLYFLISKLTILVPFKRAVSKLVYILNALRNNDTQVLSTLRFLWASKNTP